MDFLLPEEKVKIKKRPNWVAILIIAIPIYIKIAPHLPPKDIGLGVLSRVALLLILYLLCIRISYIITDRRIIFVLDFFLIRWLKAIFIEDVKGVSRLDIPLLKLIFKKTIGFLVFYTANPLALICFPLITAPAKAEEIFYRIKLSLPEPDIENPRQKQEETPQGFPCPECGNLLQPDTKFCNKCGTKI